ncbi:MAG TPA: hypothetical protein VK459_24600, partial [Polyangiaceae bacterium]|nr:hypothetical protein [Polyangiaceae bacterium]
MKALRASTSTSRGIGIALLLAASVASAPAFAQDTAAAEVLFLEAKDLMTRGQFAEACPKLEASYKLDKTVGTLMNAADCHEKVGKIATAWGKWGSAYDWLKRDGDKRAAFAEQRRSALAARLPKLQITVTGTASSLDVYRGSIKVDPAAYNLALPVDPGPHIITVRRGDQVLKEERVELAEGATAATSIDLEAIEKSNPPPAPTGPAQGSVTAPPPPPPSLPPPPTSYRSTGFTVGGIGVGVLAVGGILGLVALQSMSATDDPDACIGIYCSPTGIEAIDRAKLFAEAGQWVGIGGIVMIGIGATLILTSPSGSPPAR